MARLLVLVGFAGALGTVTRYLVGLWAARALGTGFPFGTLIVNLVGCFLIAAVTQVAASTMLVSPTLKLALTTGFMGGLTTYSSFNLDTTLFLESRNSFTAAVNFGVTTVGCFAAGLLGFVIARRMFGH
jgi:fluoride exporter